MKRSTSKLVNQMVSKTKHIKNKLLKNGQVEFKNEDSNEIATTQNKNQKSIAKNAKVLYLKSQLTPSYKPLSI